jgi:hypothetical protein
MWMWGDQEPQNPQLADQRAINTTYNRATQRESVETTSATILIGVRPGYSSSLLSPVAGRDPWSGFTGK